MLLPGLLAPCRRVDPESLGGRGFFEAIDFVRQLNTLTHSEHDGSMTIAEESTAWPSVSRPTYVGGLGFTYKWNMGWMNDILEYVGKDPVYRRYEHRHLTFSLIAFSEKLILPFYVDEVVHGKGIDVREDLRATTGRRRPRCACSTRSCTRTRARS